MPDAEGAGPAVGVSAIDGFVLRAALWVSCALITANVLVIVLEEENTQVPGLWGHMVRQLTLGWEGNFATWFRSMLLFLNALSAYVWAKRAAGMDRRLELGARVMAVGFLVLSVDDVVQLHEFAERRLRGEAVVEAAAWEYVGLLFGMAAAGCLVGYLLLFGRNAASRRRISVGAGAWRPCSRRGARCWRS